MALPLGSIFEKEGVNPHPPASRGTVSHGTVSQKAEVFWILSRTALVMELQKEEFPGEACGGGSAEQSELMWCIPIPVSSPAPENRVRTDDAARTGFLHRLGELERPA